MNVKDSPETLMCESNAVETKSNTTIHTKGIF